MFNEFKSRPSKAVPKAQVIDDYIEFGPRLPIAQIAQEPAPKSPCEMLRDSFNDAASGCIERTKQRCCP